MHDLSLNVELCPGGQMPHKVVHSIPVQDEKSMLRGRRPGQEVVHAISQTRYYLHTIDTYLWYTKRLPSMPSLVHFPPRYLYRTT